MYFSEGRHSIYPKSFPVLEKLCKVLKENPKIRISIEGHVCCVTDLPDAFDIESHEPFLSVSRAKAIYNYLIEAGIDESRLRYEGFGRSRPVIRDEKDEDDAKKNRRVEIRIVDN